MSHYESMSTKDLTDLLARVEARNAAPDYEPCDNLSDSGCCDDCGLYEMREVLASRIQRDSDNLVNLVDMRTIGYGLLAPDGHLVTKWDVLPTPADQVSELFDWCMADQPGLPVVVMCEDVKPMGTLPVPMFALRALWRMVQVGVDLATMTDTCDHGHECLYHGVREDGSVVAHGGFEMLPAMDNVTRRALHGEQPERLITRLVPIA